jgi:hypothetical protein
VGDVLLIPEGRQPLGGPQRGAPRS